MGLSPTLSALGGADHEAQYLARRSRRAPAQTCAAVLDSGTGELRRVRLRMPPIEVVEFLAGGVVRSRRSTRPGRPGSVWRV